MSWSLLCSLAPLTQESRHCMDSSDSDQTEFPHSHPTEFFPFNVSSFLEGFLEEWVGLFVEKENNRHVLGWCLHHQTPGLLGRVRPDLQLRGSCWGSLRGRGLGEGWGSFQIPAWGFCRGKGLVGQQWGGNAASLL